MWIKIIVLLAMLAVLVNLFTALFHLMKGEQGHSEKNLKHLTWRLVFSIGILVFLVVASFLGGVAPHGLPQAGETTTPAQAP